MTGNCYIDSSVRARSRAYLANYTTYIVKNEIADSLCGAVEVKHRPIPSAAVPEVWPFRLLPVALVRLYESQNTICPPVGPSALIGNVVLLFGPLWIVVRGKEQRFAGTLGDTDKREIE